MDRQNIVNDLAEALREETPGPIAAYLFGSVARNTMTRHSDVDVAVLMAEEPEATLAGMGFDIAHRLERKIGRPVDVVVLNGASPDLIHRVLRDGVLLIETDRKARVSFEVRARAQYFDLAPVRREYRKRKAAS